MPRLALRPLPSDRGLGLDGGDRRSSGSGRPARGSGDRQGRRRFARAWAYGSSRHQRYDRREMVRQLHQRPRPGQVLFSQGRRRGVQKEGTTLDDQIREGNIDFAKKVFGRFLERPRTNATKPRWNCSRKKRDFAVDEYLSDDPEKLQCPPARAQANERLHAEGQVRSALFQGGRRHRRGRSGSQVDDPLSRPQPPGPPGRYRRIDGDLPVEPHQNLRPSHLVPRPQEPRGHAQSAAPSLSGRDRCFATL